MSRLFMVLAILVLVATLVAALGPSLPAGNPLHDAGQGLREVVNFMIRGFAG